MIKVINVPNTILVITIHVLYVISKMEIYIKKILIEKVFSFFFNKIP